MVYGAKSGVCGIPSPMFLRSNLYREGLKDDLISSAWVVRAGQRGENEHWNIEHGRVSVGWPEAGDLSPATSR